MTEPINPHIPWRIVGDRVVTDEVFIPGPLRLPSPPTEEEQKARAAAAERREADRQAEMQAHATRHAELLTRHTDSPILLALLEEHGPRSARWAGQTVQECHGCPTYWTDDEYGTHSGEVHHEWPCPTWTTIAEQSGA